MTPELTAAALQKLTDEELTTLCAERVMGWYEEPSHYVKDVWHWEKCGGVVYVSRDERSPSQEVWNPVKNIHHYHEMIEEIERRGLYWNLSTGDVTNCVQCNLFRLQQQYGVGKDLRNGCIAALLAVSRP